MKEKFKIMMEGKEMRKKRMMMVTMKSKKS